MRFIAEGSYGDRLKIEWHDGGIPRRHNESGEKNGASKRASERACARARVRAISANARGKSCNAARRGPASDDGALTREKRAQRSSTVAALSLVASCCFNKAARVHERKAN